MSLRSRAHPHGRPVDAETYRRSFLGQVHCLIGRGFQEISRHGLGNKDETAITGLLTKAIEDLLDDRQAPDWADRFSIQDERHVSDSEREGKRRLRVDIELVSSGSRPRPRFQIEAKRLRNPARKSLEDYLGEDGLGSFLSCRYARNHPWAGMMGYVQTETADQWANRIRAALEERLDDLLVVPRTKVLSPQVFDISLPHVYRSDHLRQKTRPIEIHHIFLHCS